MTVLKSDLSGDDVTRIVNREEEEKNNNQITIISIVSHN
jgi:hypothetical protein